MICTAYNNLPFFLAVIAAAAILIIDRLWKGIDKGIVTYLAAAAIVASIICFWRSWIAGGGAFLGIFVPRFAILLIIFVTAFSILFLFSLHQYHQNRDKNVAPWVAAFLMLLFGIVLALATANLVIIFAGIVIMSFSAAILLGGGISLSAIGVYWRYSMVVDFVLCMGIAFYFGATGTFVITDQAEVLRVINEMHTANYFRLSMAVIAAAFLAHLALFPLHHPSLEAGITASPPAASIVNIFYRMGMAFIALKIFLALSNTWPSFLTVPVFVLVLSSLCYANLMMARAHDIRSFIFYSSLAGISYCMAIFPALAVHDGGAVLAVIFCLISFGLSHFGLAAALQVLCREESGFGSIDGLGRDRPAIALLLGVYLLAIAGIPPFMVFLSRVMMLRSVIVADFYPVFAALLVNMAFTLYCSTRLLVRIYAFEPEGGGRGAEGGDISYPLIAMIAIPILALLFFGIFPNSLIDLISASGR